VSASIRIALGLLRIAASSLALILPETLTVKRGDTAVWVNKTRFPTR